MSKPSLERFESEGVALLGDEGLPGGVAFGFTERAGGVSTGAYASLNLGDRCGDDPDAVAENRRRALAALGAGGAMGRLVNPKQVHGDRVVTITDGSAEAVHAAQRQAAAGADAVVCTAAGVPVLLCYADCVPVVLVAEGAFAVVHSGWRGTLARIAAKAAVRLCKASGARMGEVSAYIGPHIAGADYEVSAELLERFVSEFGDAARASERHLDLEAAIASALADVGVAPERVCSCGISTPRATDRFFSYRASGGTCGRHGAIAWIPTSGRDGR